MQTFSKSTTMDRSIKILITITNPLTITKMTTNNTINSNLNSTSSKHPLKVIQCIFNLKVLLLVKDQDHSEYMFSVCIG